MVYPYITGSVCYVNPYWAQPLYIYLLLTNSCMEIIIIFVCSVVHCATLHLNLNASTMCQYFLSNQKNISSLDIE